jgi:hypothetical protein
MYICIYVHIYIYILSSSCASTDILATRPCMYRMHENAYVCMYVCWDIRPRAHECIGCRRMHMYVCMLGHRLRASECIGCTRMHTYACTYVVNALLTCRMQKYVWKQRAPCFHFLGNVSWLAAQDPAHMLSHDTYIHITGVSLRSHDTPTDIRTSNEALTLSNREIWASASLTPDTCLYLCVCVCVCVCVAFAVEWNHFEVWIADTCQRITERDGRYQRSVKESHEVGTGR